MIKSSQEAEALISYLTNVLNREDEPDQSEWIDITEGYLDAVKQIKLGLDLVEGLQTLVAEDDDT